MTDTRLTLLEQWLTARLGTTISILEPASSDASFRRYFRVKFINQGSLSSINLESSYIVMDAPPDKEDTSSFEKIDDWLFSLGVPVPEIVARDHQQGFLLLEDLGNRTLLNELNIETVDKFYKKAIDELVAFQIKTKQQPLNLPDYNAQRLRTEMELFREWYLPKHIRYTPTEKENEELDKLIEQLIQSALEQPHVFVHRDFHSRNLMVKEDGNLGIIDFQDGVWGPITYDLASLLRDVYIQWPQEKIDEWLKYYYHKATEAELLTEISFKQFVKWFDLMGLQRHIKIAGIFTRLYHRDGKENYLNDIPLTLDYIKQINQKFPNLYTISILN